MLHSAPAYARSYLSGVVGFFFVERRVHLRTQSLELRLVLVGVPDVLFHEIVGVLLGTVHDQAERQQERVVEHGREHVLVNGIGVRDALHDHPAVGRPRHVYAVAEQRRRRRPRLDAVHFWLTVGHLLQVVNVKRQPHRVEVPGPVFERVHRRVRVRFRVRQRREFPFVQQLGQMIEVHGRDVQGRVAKARRHGRHQRRQHRYGPGSLGHEQLQVVADQRQPVFFICNRCPNVISIRYKM